MINGLIIEGDLIIRGGTQAIYPGGRWSRIGLAWKVLRGKPIIVSNPLTITNNVIKGRIARG